MHRPGAAEGEQLVHFRDHGKIFIKVGSALGSDNLALGTQQVTVGAGIPIHRHFQMDEAFYVLEGSGIFLLNDARHPFEKTEQRRRTPHLPREGRFFGRNHELGVGDLLLESLDLVRGEIDERGRSAPAASAGTAPCPSSAAPRSRMALAGATSLSARAEGARAIDARTSSNAQASGCGPARSSAPSEYRSR